MTFELFDDAFERGILGRLRLGRARTAFFGRLLERRSVELQELAVFEGDAASTLPSDLPAPVTSVLRRALEGDHPREVAGAADAFDDDRGGIEFASRDQRHAAGSALLGYLDVYAAFAGALTSLEMDLRRSPR